MTRLNDHSLKHRVHANFNRAAAHYDRAASLQRQVGDHLRKWLPERWCPEVLLDAGAGTGFFSQQLQNTYPEALVLSLDIAEAMSQQAKQKVTSVLTGDFDALPLAKQSVTGIFSNLALQWSMDLSHSLQELRRVLKPGGFLVFSTLLDQTFIELKHAWTAIDYREHVQHFLTAPEIRQNLLAQGFTDVVWQQQTITVYAREVSELLHKIKAVGASAVPNRNKGLMSKRNFAALLAAYEQYRTPAGLLPLTYEVMYGKAMVCHRH